MSNCCTPTRIVQVLAGGAAVPVKIETATGNTSVVTVVGAALDGGDLINFTVDGTNVMSLSNDKLSLNGIMIDPPTALELMQVASIPSAATNDANTLWINSADGHLWKGAVDLESGSGSDRIHATETLVGPVTSGVPTLTEIQTFATNAAASNAIIYYTGDDLPASTPTYVYYADNSGVVTLLKEPAATGTKQYVFTDIVARDAQAGTVDGDVGYVVDASADTTVVSGAALYVYSSATWVKIGEFESLDIVAFVGSTALADGVQGFVPKPLIADTDRFLKGDGTWADVLGNNREFADATGVAAADTPNPTTVEIAAFALANTITDTIVYYTGDDLAGSAITHVFHVDQSGATTLILEPTTSATLNNYSSSGDPTVTDDVNAGYTVGSRWLNSTWKKEWVLIDDTAGAAVWYFVRNYVSYNNVFTNVTAKPNANVSLQTLLEATGDVASTFTVDTPTTGSSELSQRFMVTLSNKNTADITVTFHSDYIRSDGVDHNGTIGSVVIPKNDSHTFEFSYNQKSGAGDVYRLISSTYEFPPLTQPKYVNDFNATTDWGAVDGNGDYVMIVAAATHGITVPSVQVWEFDGTDHSLVAPQEVKLLANGDVHVKAVSVPDGRYAGKLVVA